MPQIVRFAWSMRLIACLRRQSSEQVETLIVPYDHLWNFFERAVGLEEVEPLDKRSAGAGWLELDVRSMVMREANGVAENSGFCGIVGCFVCGSLE